MIVDSEGVRINTYCVAPIYIKTKNNGDIENRLYLKWPVSIGKDDDLSKKIRRKDSWVLYYGFGLTPPFGTATNWSGLLFIKRGYVPVVSHNRYDTIYPKTLVMTKGDSERALSLLLSKDKNSDEIRELFQITDVKRTWDIVDEYSGSDREMLKKCYYGQENSKGFQNN